MSLETHAGSSEGLAPGFTRYAVMAPFMTAPFVAANRFADAGAADGASSQRTPLSSSQLASAAGNTAARGPDDGGVISSGVL